MTPTRGTATTPQEQDTNRSSRTPQPPPGWPYNGPKDESLFVSQGESEHNSWHGCESEHEGKLDNEDVLEWPCACGDGYKTEGGWICCDKLNCRIKWYHLACVGLSKPPAEQWICRQCRARTRKVSVAKPDPKKKGIAIKVTPKKGQGHRRSWRELSSDEGEEYKRKVDSAREVQILPGKTRSGAGQDPVYSEDESESTKNEKTPRQKIRMDGPKKVDIPRENNNALGSDADSHVSTPGKNFDTDYPERASYISAPYDDEHDSGYAEDSKYPTNVQTPPTPAPGSGCWSESSEAEWDGDADEPHEAAHHTEQATTIEDEATSPAEDDLSSKDWETADETASETVESTPEADLMSSHPPVRSSRPTTPEAASPLLSIASSMTGEEHGRRTSGLVTHTKGDQALMAALRGSWVSHYFAQIAED